MIARQVFGSTPGSTPIVMAAVADPVGQRIIASLARPGANVTGLANQPDEILPRSLGLFARMLRDKATVAVLTDASSNVHPRMWQSLEPLAVPLQLRLVQFQAGLRFGQASLPEAFDAAVRHQADGILVLHDKPFFFAHRDEIVALAAHHRLPSMYGAREFVDAGGLISYGESLSAAFRSVAGHVGKIVAGVRPSEMPVA